MLHSVPKTDVVRRTIVDGSLGLDKQIHHTNVAFLRSLRQGELGTAIGNV
jgi:hypothetical protein